MAIKSANTSQEDNISQDDGNLLNKSIQSITSKRGRPSIPEQWTGIVKVEPGQQQIQLDIRPIATDLEEGNAMSVAPRSVRGGAPWAIVFHPDHYWKEHPNLTLENTKLSDTKL